MTRARKEDGDKSNFSWLLPHNGAESFFFQKHMHMVHHTYSYFFDQTSKRTDLKVQILYFTNSLHVPITQGCWIFISFSLKTPKKVYEIFTEITKCENSNLTPLCSISSAVGANT